MRQLEQSCLVSSRRFPQLRQNRFESKLYASTLCLRCHSARLIPRCQLGRVRCSTGLINRLRNPFCFFGGGPRRLPYSSYSPSCGYSWLNGLRLRLLSYYAFPVVKLGVDLGAQTTAAHANRMRASITENTEYLKLPDLAAPFQGNTPISRR
jgi:hypothetical protein